MLCEGYLDIKDVLSIKGLREAQMYLLNEIQKVYESQGIAIHDKHFETIIRKMSDKVAIDNEGDTKFIVGEVTSKYQFDRENKKVLAQGGQPAIGRVSILGITRAATYSDSWLSAASFQHTTTVLTDASIKGQIDNLVGLKENVIIGRLIPVTAELLEKYYGDGEVIQSAQAADTQQSSAENDIAEKVAEKALVDDVVEEFVEEDPSDEELLNQSDDVDVEESQEVEEIDIEKVVN